MSEAISGSRPRMSPVFARASTGQVAQGPPKPRQRRKEQNYVTKSDNVRHRIVPEFLIFTPLEAARILAFECRARLIREFWRDDRGQRRAGDPPQPDALRNLGASAAVILPRAVTNGGIRAGFGNASTLGVEDARAIRRENSAVASVGYLIRQQGQSCEGHSQ